MNEIKIFSDHEFGEIRAAEHPKDGGGRLPAPGGKEAVLPGVRRGRCRYGGPHQAQAHAHTDQLTPGRHKIQLLSQ